MRSPFPRPLAALVLLSLAPGCQLSSGAFFPAHSRSDGRTAERVWVEPVLVDAAGQLVTSASGGPDWTPEEQAAFFADWDAAFPEAERHTAFQWRPFPKLATLGRATNEAEVAETIADDAVAAVIDVALKLLERSLTEEASKYEAQFGANYAIDGFWETGCFNDRLHYRPRFAGFRVRRSIAGNPHAHSLALGLAPSRDLQFFRIAPLSVAVGRSKAKVLSDEFLSWALPTSLLRKLFQTDGHHLRVKVHVEVDGYERVSGKDDERVDVATLAGAEFRLPQYDLDEALPLRAADGCRALSGMATAWIAMVRPDPLLGLRSEYRFRASCEAYASAMVISLLRGRFPSLMRTGDAAIAHQGNLLLRVLVTESDPSNIQELLEDGAELVSKQREKLGEKRKEDRDED